MFACSLWPFTVTHTEVQNLLNQCYRFPITRTLRTQRYFSCSWWIDPFPKLPDVPCQNATGIRRTRRIERMSPRESNEIPGWTSSRSHGTGNSVTVLSSVVQGHLWREGECVCEVSSYQRKPDPVVTGQTGIPMRSFFFFTVFMPVSRRTSSSSDSSISSSAEKRISDSESSWDRARL